MAQHLSRTARMTVLGLALRSFMGERRMSGRKLAAVSGVPYATLRRYLEGKREAPVTTLWVLADTLGYPLSVIIARADELLAACPGDEIVQTVIRSALTEHDE